MESLLWSLPLDCSHPGAPGGPEFALDVSDGVVVRAEVRPGRLHRGAEKLFASRDYRSLLVLADRHDWLSAYGSELNLAELIERFLGIEVPLRARWLRLLLAEYTRIAHHLEWLRALAEELGLDAQPWRRARAEVLARLEELSGARLHLMFCVVGGLRADADDVWLRSVTGGLAGLQATAAAAAELAEHPRLRGLAMLNLQDARAFATSGPVARASGVAWDVRWDQAAESLLRDHPDAPLRLVSRTDGDARARFQVVAEELGVSVGAVAACVKELDGVAGPVDVPLPRSIRLPEGHGYHAGENPSGANGWYLKSSGGPTPARVKLRTSAFNNAAALSRALPGTRTEDLPLALLSFFLIPGAIDK